MPLSVWLAGQQPSRLQRAGRYVPASMAHPGKMLPAIAAQAIADYTDPGDLVLDPMCGIGTTLVEAVHLGRDAVGVEYEPPWAQLARRNLHHARSQGATGHGHVISGDARQIGTLLEPELERPGGAGADLTAVRGVAARAGHRPPRRRSRQARLPLQPRPRTTSPTSASTGSSTRWSTSSPAASLSCDRAGSSP